ncbi:MAG: substrate binding domain-containing protein, partial [Inquilinus limosus]|nr:substrate binding domain-containing protein [Inquilinus limosus]
DRFVDLVQEGFDIAVRSHFAPLPDSELVERRMSVERITLVAAPDYLARRGIPREPEDLKHHDGLLTGPSATVWRLRHRDGREAQVALGSSFVADESIVLLKAAVAGLGVVCAPETMSADARVAGTLTHVLPEWEAGTVWTTLLTPHRRGQLPAVRAVIDFLAREGG